MTDVTGFGLIGHAREMALGSKVSMQIQRLARATLGGGAGMRPRRICSRRPEGEPRVYRRAAPSSPMLCRTKSADAALRSADGGRLLISVAAKDAERLVVGLRNSGIDAVEIGEVVPKQKPLITVLS